MDLENDRSHTKTRAATCLRSVKKGKRKWWRWEASDSDGL